MPLDKITHRLKQLRNLEFFNIFFLPACLIFVLTQRKVENWQPYAYSMFVICFILAQGVYYWHLKLREVRKIQEIPRHFFQTFTRLKFINMLLLLLFPVLGLLGWVIDELHFQISIWSLLMYVFAILEFINYFYYQLSHDSKNDVRYLFKHKRLRRSLLYKDMLKMRNVYGSHGYAE